MGGAIAAWLAREHTPGGLIVESTFSSVPELAAELYRFLPVRWLSRFRYTTSEYVAGANCPVLVIHSREDDIIPFHHGEAVFRAANEPRMFLEIGGPHNGAHILDEERYLAGVRRFLRRLPLPSEDRLPVSPE